MIKLYQHALINQMLYKKIKKKIVTTLCARANVQPVGRMSLEPWLTILQSQWKLESLSKSKIVSVRQLISSLNWYEWKGFVIAFKKNP